MLLFFIYTRSDSRGLWPVTKTAGLYDGSNNRNKNNINIPRQRKVTENAGKKIIIITTIIIMMRLNFL